MVQAPNHSFLRLLVAVASLVLPCGVALSCPLSCMERIVRALGFIARGGVILLRLGQPFLWSRQKVLLRVRQWSFCGREGFFSEQLGRRLSGSAR